MSHTGTWWGAPPNRTLAWNSEAAAVTSAAAPGWSMYGRATNASANSGLGTLLSSTVAGTPWGAPEWLRTFDNSGSVALWTDAFLATMTFHNNRLIVVQNFGSVQHNPGALGALISVLETAPLSGCFVDAATGLTATALNGSAWLLGWNPGGADVAKQVQYFFQFASVIFNHYSTSFKSHAWPAHACSVFHSWWTWRSHRSRCCPPGGLPRRWCRFPYPRAPTRWSSLSRMGRCRRFTLMWRRLAAGNCRPCPRKRRYPT